jgi:Holliday junction resolvasome RuvABC endonuclease subunit
MTIHKYNKDLILKGTFISIDPSSGSNSSMPAYAVYKESRLISSGTIELNLNKDLMYRLADLTKQLGKVLEEYPDINLAVVENIPVIPGKFSHHSLSSLMKSVGAIAGAFDPDTITFIEIMPRTWRKFAGEGYQKTDVGDAIQIGRAAIELAKLLKEPKEKKSKKA